LKKAGQKLLYRLLFNGTFFIRLDRLISKLCNIILLNY
jgi:hypothetical protein